MDKNFEAILPGKKVILFPFDVRRDFDLMIDWFKDYGDILFLAETQDRVKHILGELLVAYNNGRALIWVGYTNRGEESRPSGIVWLADININSAIIAGVHVPGAMRLPRKRRGRLRYSDAQEAVRLVTGFGFDKLKLMRIESEILASNKASISLLEKSGYTKEGTFEKRVIVRGETADTVMLACINGALKDNKDNVRASAKEPELQGAVHG